MSAVLGGGGMSQWPLITVHNCDHVCKGALCVCGGGALCALSRDRVPYNG